MSARYQCPACGVKLTLASTPEPKFECPGCEKWVTLSPVGGAPPSPPPVPARPAPPKPAPARPVAPPAADGFDLPHAPAVPTETPPKGWANPRVKVGVIAGGAALALFALVFALRSADKPIDQAKADPPAVVPPVVVPPVVVPPEKAPVAEPVPKKKVLVRSLPDGVEPMIDARPQPAKPPGPQEVARAPYPNPLFKIVEPKRVFDQFGNETGSDLGLARDGEFKGQRILFWAIDYGGRNPFGDTNPLWKALEDKGFKVRREHAPFNKEWLKETDQFWMLSSCRGVKISPDDQDAIADFVKAGKGLCILADNDPCAGDANAMTKHLYGIGVSGNYPGTKIAYVRGRELRPEDIKKYGGNYEVANHFILTGVNFLYEGITISNIQQSEKMEVALLASDGKPLLAISRVPEHRVIIDCGFTRYYDGYIQKTAGTTRLAQNMAAYLAGKGSPQKP